MLAGVRALLEQAIAEIPKNIYGDHMDDEMCVRDVIDFARELMEADEVALAYEELEDLGCEYDMSPAFRECMAQAAALLEDEFLGDLG